jgi:hypothetical protein
MAPPPQDIESFRDLCDQVAEYTGGSLFDEVLAPALPRARALVVPLQRYRTRQPAGSVVLEDSWSLFALSVLCDALLQPLCVTQQQYCRFFGELGFEPFSGGDFSPLRHEVVRASVDPALGDSLRVEHADWPGLMLGQLVFARAGVHVGCGPTAPLDPHIAERSTLYFAHQRFHRAANDLSHGWGHNSRWRTQFHFFYEEEALAVFNAYGTIDLARPPPYKVHGGDPNEELPLAARRELLMHRSLVVSPGRSDDWFPYGDTLTLRREGPLWPFREESLVPRAAPP